jgi:N-acyl-phosphatidylethanolamine-hydrolysing phospholipase D
LPFRSGTLNIILRINLVEVASLSLEKEITSATPAKVRGFRSTMASTVLAASRRMMPSATTSRTMASKSFVGRGSRYSQQHLQRRHYYYVPTTWAEFQERFARWSESAEQRTVRVQLLKEQQLLLEQQRQALNQLILQQQQQATKEQQTLRQRPKGFGSLRRQGSRQSLRLRQRLREQQQQNRQALAAAPWATTTLPSPLLLSTTTTTTTSAKSSRVGDVPVVPPHIRLRDLMRQFILDGGNGGMFRDRYQGWKSKQRARYQGWKSRRQEQWSDFKQRSKLKQLQRSSAHSPTVTTSTTFPQKTMLSHWPRRLAQASRRTRYRIVANMKQINRMMFRTKTITLTEYSRPEWFDALGRPLTSRDSIGRFVNPWQSQSTNGVQSLSTILAWRLVRISRNVAQSGLFRSLIPRISWNGSTTTSTSTTTTNTSCTATTTPLRQDRVPPLPLPLKDKSNNNDIQFTWIGHSTCWVQLGGFSILTDPIFSLRSSPYQFLPIGVAREIPPAHSITDLLHHYQQLNAPTREDHQYSNIQGNGGAAATSKMDVCCISHDHYDHMDKNSVLALRDYVSMWVVPLGIKEWLVEMCDIAPESVVELAWWQQAHLIKTTTTNIDKNGIAKTLIYVHVEGVSDDSILSSMVDGQNQNQEQRRLTITCCPAQHWSSRTLFDRNTRLWCSFALQDTTFLDRNESASTSAAATTTTDNGTGGGAKFFFCGDTGYPQFPLFRQIGDALGPFDLAAIPIGAYKPESMMKEAHLDPTEALNVHFELQSKKSVGIHWGSFPLAEEGMEEPPLRLQEALQSEFQRLMQNYKKERRRDRHDLILALDDTSTDDDKSAMDHSIDAVKEAKHEWLQQLPSLPSLDFATLEHGETIRVPVGGGGGVTSMMTTAADKRTVSPGDLDEDGSSPPLFKANSVCR